MSQEISNKRVFATTQAAAFLDGSTVDAQGFFAVPDCGDLTT